MVDDNQSDAQQGVVRCDQSTLTALVEKLAALINRRGVMDAQELWSSMQMFVFNGFDLRRRLISEW